MTTASFENNDVETLTIEYTETINPSPAVKPMRLNPAELETVIFDIAKHELRAIVYLGALLGFLMGFINLLL